MNWEIVGTWLGPIVSTFGFIFVWLQLKREQIARETQTRWQIYGLGLKVLTMFVQNPELRPYFYDRKPAPKKEPARSKVLAAVELVCDHLENIILSKNSIDRETILLWKKYMSRLYENSPAMRDFLALNREGQRYSEEFFRIISANFRKKGSRKKGQKKGSSKKRSSLAVKHHAQFRRPSARPAILQYAPK
jgi:hypothetical protein